MGVIFGTRTVRGKTLPLDRVPDSVRDILAKAEANLAELLAALHTART
ncbi:hypothetical protein [Amycolatopsis circi]|nr:hypothetical protein [Amycolatopsis circi]